ncbi:TonB-dependent receptor domain-containing protein [Spirosoma spitsbergense]|uniref:TonB-dependent receptor domain-containing protein n=1 Tax=Spirosoma spitsbergense TaxID=431554 RepID=UPI00047734EE|nr:TonB-dependent receptor [Spirosoma spitsbergense]
MTFSSFLYALPVSLLPICTVAAQQPATQSNGLLQAIGMKPDTVAPLSRPDSMRLNRAQSGSPGLAVPATNAPAADNVLNARQPDEDFVPETYYSAETDDANAPKTGKLSGRLMAVQEGKTKAVPFASIGLFMAKDSSSAGGGLTDEKGLFSIPNLAPGRYYALVQSIGFEQKTLPRIVITQSKPTIDLGTITLKQATRQLAEVVVQGEKPAYEYTLDRKIVNVDQLPIAQGGSAIDILQNVPSVTVDVDGALSLRGSSNVIVLVDGKPSGLTGLDRQAVLDQIPASNIERIEVITNPSSKFDADGGAGIINIVLKKEQANGFNGSVQLNVGTRDKYNGSINANARFKKLNLFGSYNFREDHRFQYRVSERQNLFTDSVSYLAQRNDAIRRRVNNNLRLGFDYALTDHDNITASALYRPGYSYDSEAETFNTLDANRISLGKTFRTNEEREPQRGLDYKFGYRRTFDKEGRELTADATLSTNKGTEYQNFTNTTTLPPNLLASSFLIGDQRATNDQNNRVAVLQTDYVEPLKEKQKLEAGLKYTYRRLGANYVFENRQDDEWILNTAISNNFIYNERTSAAYANYGNELKKFSYQVGLRTEYTTISTDQRTTGQQNNQQYIYLFPSAFFNYNLSQAQKMQVNYTRRINRPSVRSLNPFFDLQDPLNIRYGNPFLNPELINSFELSHLWTGKSTSLTSSLFYRQTNNEITRYRTLRDDGITEQTYLNLNRSQNYGLELVLEQELTRWWKINGTATFFQRTIQASADIPGLLTRTNKSWTSRITSNFRPLRSTSIQVAVNYRSPFIVAQGTIQEFFNVNVGVKQDVLKGKGTLSFRMSDIFNTLRFQIDSFGSNFVANTIGKRESRIGFIGFTYRLGSQKSKGRDSDRQSDDIGGGGGGMNN